MAENRCGSMDSSEGGTEGTYMKSKTTRDGKSIMRAAPLPPVPEGISKSQWKKICRKKQFEETKAEYSLIRREKKAKARSVRRQKIQEFLDKGEEVPEELKKPPKVNLNQKDSGISIILDCSFDELMNDKEIVSLSTQITRAYSCLLYTSRCV